MSSTEQDFAAIRIMTALQFGSRLKPYSKRRFPRISRVWSPAFRRSAVMKRLTIDSCDMLCYLARHESYGNRINLGSEYFR